MSINNYIKAAVSTPTLQVIEPAPRVQITVASGLDGRRGSYIFAGPLLDPSDATSYIEITHSADVRPLEYDIYISMVNGSQWQLLYNGMGELQWMFIIKPETVQILKDKFTIPAGSPLSYELVHNRDTLDVDVFVYRNVPPYVSVGCYVERTTPNKLTLKFIDSSDDDLVAVVVSYL